MTNQKTPWHIWVVGIVALLWNAGGAMDFTMSNMRIESYMAQYSPEQLSFFTTYPTWVTITWGIAVWGAILGSILILLRKKLAAPVFLVALLALIITSVHNFYLSEIKMYEIVGMGALWFSLVIFVIAVLLWLYCRKQAELGNLR